MIKVPFKIIGTFINILDKLGEGVTDTALKYDHNQRYLKKKEKEKLSPKK